LSDITISVVSHNQESLLRRFLVDVGRHSSHETVVVTHNVGSTLSPILPFESTRRIINLYPKGFGANHNAAFGNCSTQYFCVANPDIRLTENPFPALLDCMRDPSVGLVVPLAVTSGGSYDGNARRFPTPRRLFNKLICGDDARYQGFVDVPMPVDWAAGMFMLFRAEAFEAVGGFDEGFHLYYEDVDICTRLWSAGWRVLLQPGAQVTHEAQRTSHRNMRYMSFHLAGMARYFYKHAGRLPVTGWD
jgi:N-acetylglucosaminyl-diphospho-decaprenol L-rhamnosyltransferase